ncbi:MAG: hypothetical protein LBF27_14010 [Sphingobacterium sp.]|jgi:hypothetical protein|nr:hypothetical protein [Sphingobacterium sp.]
MMLENITWKSYLSAVAAMVIIYYAFYLIFFYRRSLKAKFQGTKLGKGSDQYSEGSILDLDMLTEEIRHSILEAAGKEVSKEELIVQFRHRLANYDGLSQPAVQHAINNFLIPASESICGVTFSDHELNQQWDSLVKLSEEQ